MTLTFFVPGTPRPGGSKKPFRIPTTGQIVLTDAGKYTKEWRAVVTHEAFAAAGGRPLLSDALNLDVIFFLRRPKGHFGSGKNAGVLKASARPYPISKPDATKLVRALEDAMTGIVWRDDAQVVDQRARKLYTDAEHPTEGALVVVQVMGAGENGGSLAGEDVTAEKKP